SGKRSLGDTGAAFSSPEVGVQVVGPGRRAPGIEVLAGRDLPVRYRPRRLGDGQLEQLAHHCASACGEGTLNAPSAGSGARSSMASLGQLGLGSSGLSTFSRLTTWD